MQPAAPQQPNALAPLGPGYSEAAPPGAYYPPPQNQYPPQMENNQYGVENSNYMNNYAGHNQHHMHAPDHNQNRFYDNDYRGHNYTPGNFEPSSEDVPFYFLR